MLEKKNLPVKTRLVLDLRFVIRLNDFVISVLVTDQLVFSRFICLPAVAANLVNT